MGWELERFPEPNQELVCCICTGVVDDPVEIRCRHIFCNVCLKTWLKNRGSSHSRRAGTCPSCRATVKHRDIRSAPHMLKNIIGKQLIRCENKARGCTETPKLDDLISHQKNCMYAEVVCQTQGCKVAFMRKDSAKHAKSCPKRRILCEKGCSLEMFLSEIASHNCVAALKAHCTSKNSFFYQFSFTHKIIKNLYTCIFLFHVWVCKSVRFLFRSLSDVLLC